MPWLTSFVGRRQEVGDVRRMLQRSRLVTVTGLAGCGKTRVAVRSAQLMRRAFSDGVHVVDLSGVTDSASLEQAVALALGCPGDLTGFLADRRVLLVLDDSDYVAESCSRLLRRLLPAAPGLHVLVTGRQALRVPGEHTVVIRPLAVPHTGCAPTEMATVESVTLLLDRAAADFTLTDANAPGIAELCRRLEGIPLALELAAARVPDHPVEHLLRGMARHHLSAQVGRRMEGHGLGGRLEGFAGQTSRSTMRDAIAWSHEMCSPEERLLWGRLAVLPGPFEPADAERACSGHDLPASRVGAVLAGLVRRFIVAREHDAGRTVFRMPRSVREFAPSQPAFARDHL
ncbi:ATP-binding protein [Nonomuraea sp. NPDC050536]|uniref:ATP-binding protein n=1 Tax=Nonomuraea sp. NPDC050536 TaxID=3364366 RepID=UPI0037CBF2F1